MTAVAFRVTASCSARRTWSDRSALIVAVPFFLAVIAVLSAVWRTAVDAVGGDLAGYDARSLTWYIVTSEAAMLALSFRLIDDVGSAISSGAVSVEMLRPTPVLATRLATELGTAAIRLGLLGATAAGYALVVVGAPPRPELIALVVPSVLLAIGCNLCAQHTFAASAFWIRDTQVAWFLYQKLVFVLGGMLIPLEVFPDGLSAVARWLPFSAMAYAPARLASGHAEPELLVIQSIWLVVLAAAAGLTFRAGERRMLEVGG